MGITPSAALQGRRKADHPHARGDHSRFWRRQRRERTIPTRVGITESTLRLSLTHRTIPTRVGITPPLPPAPRIARTIPTRVGITWRSHGGKSSETDHPHARGDHAGVRGVTSFARTIPTRVGITRPTGHWTATRTDNCSTMTKRIPILANMEGTLRTSCSLVVRACSSSEYFFMRLAENGSADTRAARSRTLHIHAT